MSNVLSKRGYGVLKKTLKNEEDIKNKLTVNPSGISYDDNIDKSFSVYLESSKKLYLPKYWGLKHFGLPDENDICKGAVIDCRFNGSLRDYQREPINAYMLAANDPLKKGGILQLPPGWGKTVMALYILCKLKVKTLIVVHKEFLMNQWKDRIDQYLTNVNVGTIKQNVIEHDNDIVIASLQSLSMRKYEDNVLSDFGLVIIDECHHMAAAVFSKALFKVNFTYALGLSATVTRKDGLTKVFKWFLGDIVYKAKPKEYDSVKVIMKYYYESDNKYNHIPLLYNGQTNIAKIINNVCQYIPRTIAIIDELDKLLQIDKEREVIILSDRRNHLNDIEKILNAKGYDSIGYYVGGMRETD